MCLCFLVDKSFPLQMKMSKPVHMGSQRIPKYFFFLWKIIDFEKRILFQIVTSTENLCSAPVKHKMLSRFSKKVT